MPRAPDAPRIGDESRSREAAMPEPDVTTDGVAARAARAAMLNLSRYHRQHERHDALAPLEGALALGRAARTLTTLADRWAAAPAPPGDGVRVPYAGCEDLNDDAVIPSDGVLFMEGEGEPPELARLRRDVTAIADDQEATGAWLASAMEASWTAAGAIRDPRLADVLGERHRIIANDWQAAGLGRLAGRLARRAVDLLARADLSPEGVRADLAGPRVTPGLLHSAAELLDRAADLTAESAMLVHDNERRWRVFRARVETMAGAPGGAPVSGGDTGR
jgi:hypothetical protein